MAWSIINRYKPKPGYLRPQLNCISFKTNKDDYIISKTTLENTGRSPIYLNYAFLLVVDQEISFEVGMSLVIRDLNMPIKNEYDVVKMHNRLKERDLWENENYILKSLPYYYIKVGVDIICIKIFKKILVLFDDRIRFIAPISALSPTGPVYY